MWQMPEGAFTDIREPQHRLLSPNSSYLFKCKLGHDLTTLRLAIPLLRLLWVCDLSGFFPCLSGFFLVFFWTMTLLKRTGGAFGRMSLHLGSGAVLSWLDWGSQMWYPCESAWYCMAYSWRCSLEAHGPHLDQRLRGCLPAASAPLLSHHFSPSLPWNWVPRSSPLSGWN